jgi:hypothetical protein
MGVCLFDQASIWPMSNWRFSISCLASSTSIAALTEAAKRHTGVQAELGLTEVLLASHLNPARIASSGVGADFDE